MITVAQFLAEYPEFDPEDGSQDALVQAKLDAAYRRTPLDVWGELRDDAAKLLAAHMLALSPFARELKLVSNDGSTIYGAQRDEYELLVSSGARVTGVTL